MITVIDMASGKLISSSTATKAEGPVTACRNELPVPTLALQEVQSETISNTMPPELADIPAALFLAKFE